MTEIIELSAEQMDALIERMESNLANGLSPEPDDVRLILLMLRQFSMMQQKLEGSSYLKQRYLKLMGLASTCETQKKHVNNSTSTQSPRKKKERPATDLIAPKVCHHVLTDLKKGQLCPECQQGRVNKHEPAAFIRITGQAPLLAEKHIMEQLRCSLCLKLFTAELPEDVLQDGARAQRYGYSAKSIMVISRFYMGNPYYRQESLQSLLGMPVSASTIYDQCALVVGVIQPVFHALKQLSADGHHFHIDDTGNRILGETAIEKPTRNGKGTRQRTGIYSSCAVVTMDDGYQTVLFNTSIGHSGEWIDEILSLRSEGLAPPIVMSDALSCNPPTVTDCHISLCNAHSRRKFIEIMHNFPEEAAYVIECYATIWQNETTIHAQKMTANARLAYHQAHSAPVMASLKRWCEDKWHNSHTTEQNSGLGKAMAYFLRHYVGLTAFCRIEGAKLDNNMAELLIKLIARGRKNSLFYKTQAGADVGDVLTSVIATCELNGINCFEYLTCLQQHRQYLEREPHRWLPWNYKQTLEENSVIAV